MPTHKVGVALSHADVAELFISMSSPSGDERTGHHLDFIELDDIMMRGATLLLPPSPGSPNSRHATTH